jgi:hypothetical protein
VSARCVRLPRKPGAGEPGVYTGAGTLQHCHAHIPFSHTHSAVVQASGWPPRAALPGADNSDEPRATSGGSCAGSPGRVWATGRPPSARSSRVMSLGAAAMSMAGSNPQAEAMSEEAKRAFEAKDYVTAVECYRAAAQIAPTCAPLCPAPPPCFVCPSLVPRPHSVLAVYSALARPDEPGRRALCPLAAIRCTPTRWAWRTKRSGTRRLLRRCTPSRHPWPRTGGRHVTRWPSCKGRSQLRRCTCQLPQSRLCWPSTSSECICILCSPYHEGE